MSARREPPAPLALSLRDAAESCGVSVDTFSRYIAGQVPTVYLGRCRLYPVDELRAWLNREAVVPAREPS